MFFLPQNHLDSILMGGYNTITFQCLTYAKSNAGVSEKLSQTSVTS